MITTDPTQQIIADAALAGFVLIRAIDLLKESRP